MGLSENVQEIIGEMIAIKHLLRKTAPDHRMGPAETERLKEAIEKSGVLLKRVKEEAGVQ